MDICLLPTRHDPPSEGNAQKSSASFRFVESPGAHLDLKFGDRNVVRFINRPHDATSEDSHYMTFKPFHQVFDPETGTVLLTSGVHPKTKEFKFPHHRGLFLVSIASAMAMGKRRIFGTETKESIVRVTRWSMSLPMKSMRPIQP